MRSSVSMASGVWKDSPDKILDFCFAVLNGGQQHVLLVVGKGSLALDRASNFFPIRAGNFEHDFVKLNIIFELGKLVRLAFLQTAFMVFAQLVLNGRRDE